MADTSEHLADRLRHEGQKTLEFFGDLTPEQWDLAVYTDGASWAVHQVMAHFVATEIGIALLVKNILAGGPGSPEDFNLNEYNERRVAKLTDLSAAELMRRFAENREASAKLVAGMTQADLQRAGRHPFLGVAPLEGIIKMMYRHNQIHQREIRKILG
jgi:hypothetical protein